VPHLDTGEIFQLAGLLAALAIAVIAYRNMRR
jgi:hypothetical protein